MPNALPCPELRIFSRSSVWDQYGALTTNFSVTPVFWRDLCFRKTWGRGFGEDIFHFGLRFLNPCSMYWLQQEPTLPAVFPSSPHQEGQPRDSFLAPLSPLHCHFCQQYLSELKLIIESKLLIFYRTLIWTHFVFVGFKKWNQFCCCWSVLRLNFPTI